MTPFLHLVAQDLHDKFGSDYSRIAIVFPNKRAGLFLNEYLLQISGGAPVWAPRYLTISDLFFSLSPEYITNDPIDSALRIVRLFQQATGDASITVERFYGWAERILSDFEDVDKNMADPDALFRNISDLKSFDDTSFLTPEQVKELQKFFGDFDTDHKGVLREKFRLLGRIIFDGHGTCGNPRSWDTELVLERLPFGLDIDQTLFLRIFFR